MDAAKTPRILWVELTSKCPFDCVFCSRKSRRGAGEHLPFAVFESLVRQVVDPRKFLLNYSGESTVYPDLVRAIGLARSTGAAVELVTALTSAPESLIEQLSTSGLTRLTVSLHAADAAEYDAIYRYGSFAGQRARLERLVGMCRGVAGAPVIDTAFVAMRRNLGALEGVARMVEELGLSGISIFPVIRRDEIPMVFAEELRGDGVHHTSFRESVNRAVAEAEARHPRVSFTIANQSFTAGAGEEALGEVPVPCPGELPSGAWVYGCEQNPWETAHVLSNGDVVACEVHDKRVLGNLARQTLEEIWHGEAYERFRRGYERGEWPECRLCPWKSAYVPGRLHSQILGARGASAQLWHGWHQAGDPGHRWSSQQAVAVLAPRAGSKVLHVSGALPPGPEGAENELSVACNGVEVGRVATPYAEMFEFGEDFAVPAEVGRPWRIEFRTRYPFVPSARGSGTDQRDLGFAMVLLASQSPRLEEGRVAPQRSALERLVSTVEWVDRAGRNRRWALRGEAAAAGDGGVSVVIPERCNVGQLRACLAGLRAATGRLRETVEVIVVVNGCERLGYRELGRDYPEVRWQFHARALSFSEAIAAGLRWARQDWVYLLNSDVVLEPGALAAVAACRAPEVFSIASQIMLRDRTRYREETNWTRLFLEDGLATTHDLIPEGRGTVEHFYAGGGASLFQRRWLGRLMAVGAYRPFYWEDVEWGWRARKMGLRSLFCEGSVAVHAQGATIGKLYSQEEVERIVQRNRLLFQLRNFTRVGRVEDVVDAIARGEDAEFFAGIGQLVSVARGRWWNFGAGIEDDAVLGQA